MRDCCISKIILTGDEGNSIFGTIELSVGMGEYNYKEELPC